MFDQEFATQQPGRIIRNLPQPLIECECLFGGRLIGGGRLTVGVLTAVTLCGTLRSDGLLCSIGVLFFLLVRRERSFGIASRLSCVLRFRFPAGLRL